MNSADFVTLNHILAEVTTTVNDEEFRNGLTKGWYVSRVQDALQELAFDTFFQKITIDLDVPQQSLQLDMPENIFNIREMYVYNGDGCCSPNNSQRVYWKRQFNNKNGNGNGYTAAVKDRGFNTGNDPFIPNGNYDYWNNMVGTTRTKYYANVSEGKIMFSSDCRGFSKVRIVANGAGTAIGDLPVIPKFLERAVNDYVEERFYNTMKARDRRAYAAAWSETYNKLNDPVNGSWKKARMRVASLDTWQKESLEEYISSMYHK